MLKGGLVTQETFDLLLDWLGGNRREAGEKYEQIRQLLINLFIHRGCFEAEELADETINRVTLKLPEVIEDYKGEPELYFYSVANKIHYEWQRQQKKIKDTTPILEADSRRQTEYDCLEMCLDNLPAKQRELIIEYYQNESHTKIPLRKILAERLNTRIDVLHLRTHRIRASLLKCVKNCVEKKL